MPTTVASEVVPAARKRITKSRVALVAVALLAAGAADPGRAVEVRDDDPFKAPVAVSPRVLAHRGVDAPVVLVTIDGVRWQEVFDGTEPARSPAYVVPGEALTPNLHALAGDRGAFVGAPGRPAFSASGPNYVSLPGYNEIFGGRPAPCRENTCPRTPAATLLDDARAAGAKVAAFSSWERIDFAATSAPGSFHGSFGRAGDKSIDPFPGRGDYRPDRHTADAALAYYEAERPDVLYLGLGDTDEYAHRGDYGAYVTALQRADAVVGQLMELLDATERGRRTHVVVTTDHGRASSFEDHGRMPEAARVWMVAAGPRWRARGALATARPRHLADIAPTLRIVLGLGPDVREGGGRPIYELFEEPALGIR